MPPLFLYADDTQLYLSIHTAPSTIFHQMYAWIKNLKTTKHSSLLLLQTLCSIKQGFLSFNSFTSEISPNSGQNFPDSVAETLMHAFITSRLDYCNGILHGVTNKALNWLQQVQNSAARVFTHSRLKQTSNTHNAPHQVLGYLKAYPPHLQISSCACPSEFYRPP